MTFRRLNQKVLEPGAQVLMVLGIIALCQPWNFLLHRYGVTMILVGLVAFIITGKIAPEEEAETGASQRSGAEPGSGATH